MNPETKAIGLFETDDDARAGHTIALSDDEASELADVPRAKRIEALGKFRGCPITTKSYIPPRRKRDRR
jgi:hypothetical protein